MAGVVRFMEYDREPCGAWLLYGRDVLRDDLRHDELCFSSLAVPVASLERRGATSKPMANTWVTDLTHYLDDAGRVANLPGRAMRLALYQGRVVEAVSRLPPGQVQPLGIACRRRPARRPCVGELQGGLDPREDCVVWGCPACGDNGYISNWRGTPWDNSSIS